MNTAARKTRARSNGKWRGTVLVTDADRGSSLAILRSLGQAGWRVIAADANKRSIGFRSRHVYEAVVYPSPVHSPQGFLDALHGAVGRFGVDLLIPVTDAVLQALVHDRQRFESHCRLAIAETEALGKVTDKEQTLELARRLEVPIPDSRIVHSVDEAISAASSMAWPLVVKPAVSARYDREQCVIQEFKVSYANSIDELRVRMTPLEGCPSIILQEYCPGTGQGVEILARDGVPVATFQHRRLAEIPVTGGASAWREGVPLDPELYEYARRIVAELRWTGLIMVEFRVGDVAKLMEVNGRVWGSLPLATHSGVDFPAALAELYFPSQTDAITTPRTDYHTGLRSCNLELTALWVIQVLLGIRRHRFLPQPRRREAVKALLGLLRSDDAFDVLSSDDPAPGYAELRKIGRKLIDKVRARGSRNKPAKLGSSEQRGEISPGGTRNSVGQRGKEFLRRSLSSPAGSGLLRLLDPIGDRRNALRVLTYHRVLDANVFAEHARFLAKHFHVVSAKELKRALSGEQSLPERSVMITFDDAYVDFAENAWPALKTHDLPVILFVPTAFPDHPERVFWWDRLEHAFAHTKRRESITSPLGPLTLASEEQRASSRRHLKRYLKTLQPEVTLRVTQEVCEALDVAPPRSLVLGWNDLRQLVKEGVTLGAHSQTHPFMSRLTRDEARTEIAGSLGDLKREIGENLPYFAYPDGQYNHHTVETLDECGVEIAFTTESGANDLPDVDPLQLRRLYVGPREKLGMVRARLIHSALLRGGSSR